MGDFVFEAIVTVLLFLLIVWACRICCRRRTNEGIVINTTPVVITSEVHRVATGTQAPTGVVVHGHPTGTVAFPAMPVTYPTVANSYSAQLGYPAQPYPVVQQYPAQSVTSVPRQDAQFPPLPPMMQHPAPGMPLPNSGPTIAPPSYDQAMSNNYAQQSPYNPDFKREN